MYLSPFEQFAGSVCILPTPTERAGFIIGFWVAVIVFSLAILTWSANSKIHQKWHTSQPAAFWNMFFKLIWLPLLLVVAIGYATGTNDTVGVCSNGIWMGIQIVLMWSVAVLIGALLVALLALSYMAMYRFIWVIWNKKLTNKQGKVLTFLAINMVSLTVYVLISWRTNINNLPVLPISIFVVSGVWLKYEMS